MGYGPANAHEHAAVPELSHVIAKAPVLLFGLPLTAHAPHPHSQGLNVCAHLIRSLRPIGPGAAESVSDYRSDAEQLFKVVNSRFVVTDIDQEVKDRAMVCMARLISNMGM
jgi:hypothetical protein